MVVSQLFFALKKNTTCCHFKEAYENIPNIFVRCYTAEEQSLKL